MKDYIAYCGLDCESCEARLATIHHDDALRRKVAALWSELNGVEITPEMIHCSGCRVPGVKTPFCDALCPIRQCALSRGVETCGSCGEMDGCERLGMITGNNADALRNLNEKQTLLIETERLRVYPASREQMEAMIASEQDGELKKAYSEMLEGCLRHLGQWDWYASWMIEQKDGTHIGDLCFKGLQENGAAEIGYGILEEYRGRGYAAEAVQAACRWALGHAEVRSLEAETDAGNLASQRVLEKCGFRPNGTFGEEGPRYTRKR